MKVIGAFFGNVVVLGRVVVSCIWIVVGIVIRRVCVRVVVIGKIVGRVVGIVVGRVIRRSVEEADVIVAGRVVCWDNCSKSLSESC